MVKKNKENKPLDVEISLDSLPKQNKKTKYEYNQIITKDDLENKIKNIKISTDAINKQIPKSFWKDYF